MAKGKVYLVGAGPGHPGLLTVRGLQLLKDADAIVYDRLVSVRLLTEAKPTVELYFVGKEANHHAVPQEDIERHLIFLANRGLCVVRLKGGDPFVFGRGAEEASALHEADIPFEIVPGITSAVAVPAFAGIPVTYRSVSPSFTVVTGHRAKADETVEWGVYAKQSGTLVILMGVRQLDGVAKGLMDGGKEGSTPVAMIRWGTRGKQETLRGTLADISRLAREREFQAPAVIVVGDVAGLGHDLNWYERLPLMGKRLFVMAQSRGELERLSVRLESLGAETFGLAYEHFAHHSTSLSNAIDSVAKDLFRYAQLGSASCGIGFRSAFAVDGFVTAMRASRTDIRTLSRIAIVAMNDAVAHHLESYGLFADTVSAKVPSSAVATTWWWEAETNGGLGKAQDVLVHASDQVVRYFRVMAPSESSAQWSRVAQEWLQDGVDVVCVSPNCQIDESCSFVVDAVSSQTPRVTLDTRQSDSAWIATVERCIHVASESAVSVR